MPPRIMDHLVRMKSLHDQLGGLIQLVERKNNVTACIPIMEEIETATRELHQHICGKPK